MIETFFCDLKKLYVELGEKIANYTKTKVSPLVPHWGNLFPRESDAGILFVGRATNGSSTEGNYMDQLEKAFEPKHYHDIEWVESRKMYKKSAFWRVIRGVALELYPDKKWFDHIAWSDIYKIAPSKKGNPDNELKKLQKSKCLEILKAEIDVLSPECVILFVGDWKEGFLYELNHKKETKSIKSIVWGYGKRNNKKYYAKVYQIDNRKYIVTEHPQCKNEEAHIKCLLELLKQ